MNLLKGKLHLAFTAFLLLAAALTLGTAGAATTSVHVTGIRHWSNPTYTRIVIDLDRKPTAYTYRLLKKDPSIHKPRRLYVDITRASLGSTLDKSIPIHDGLLKMARSGQYNPTTVRVVLDIESIGDYKVFNLEEPYRIVIDVSGEKIKTTSGRVEPVGPGPSTSGDSIDAISLSRQLGLKIRTVVLDAGHGGKDPGAIGRKGTREKDITLKLAKLVEKNLRGKVDTIILTRSRDAFIPLEERTAIANKNGADLFVSIHVNASPRRAASGIETYILDRSRDDETRMVAARENSTSTRSVSDLEFILKDLLNTSKKNDSLTLATNIQDDLVTTLRSRYRGVEGNGVKGAPFYVLVGTEMPSVLVEVSYISNPSEEKRLRNSRYLDHIADGITSGLLKYIQQNNEAYGCLECTKPAS